MPAIQNYIVTQTRTIEVVTADPVDAMRIAATAFTYNANDKPPSGGYGHFEVPGHTTGRMNVVSIHVDRK